MGIAGDGPQEMLPENVRADDVSVKITHCGVCYAKVIWPRNKFGDAIYPMVHGWLACIVQEVGPNVHRFKVGDHVGVGTYTDSCRDCEYCNNGQENYCDKEAVYTYNHFDYDGTITHGGFSTFTVVHERVSSKALFSNQYCFKILEDYPLASAAPLLCAGITVYSPMMDHKMNQPGKSLGVIGLGGLGHMAVKFGKALGLKVQAKSLDFIIDTTSGNHPIDLYMIGAFLCDVLIIISSYFS
ncbi:putative alcohol dehydrogenase (NADP(+)) [Rosa chinensis]|uniref:Putative alcohol dehydrogenase (NADP(+)) n=1 Tax=Rosa chinensis TaxID=74649 RepID=A0A2P6S199_ROSCH|nr:putative alcohol dehydrogenase (NADP(+)) [Rosa chinensis]